MKNGVSVVMPAYNEEENLAVAVADATKILKRTVGDYEIIIVNDGSSDGTADAAETLADFDRHVRVYHNRSNRGFGNGLRRGIRVARYAYCILYPSDNEMDRNSFRQLLLARTNADMVSTYMANPGARPLVRRIISGAFVAFLNLLFGLRLRYYTGPFIAKTHLLRGMPLVSDGASLLAEMRVRLLASGAHVTEIPFTFTMRKYGRATLFRWKTVHQTLFTVCVLVRDKLSGSL